jgi:hypothetical protein
MSDLHPRDLSSDSRALQKAARAPVANREDPTMWQMETVKQSRKGCKTYSYRMASWREGGKTRNVHLGSARKMDAAEARQKAREMKAEGLHAN